MSKKNEKAYKEALERAKAYHSDLTRLHHPREIVEEIFPELAESEDERIRKAIIATIEQCPDDFLNPKNRDRMLSYLEKQKEQKQYDIDVLERNITKDSVSVLAHTVIVRNGWEIVEAKEQNPANEKEYIRILKGLVADFVRDKQPKDVVLYQRIFDYLDGISVEQ